MPSRLNEGGIRMSVTRTWGYAFDRALHHLVVVGGHADHGEVTMTLDERPNALADDQVVVGQEDADHLAGDIGGGDACGGRVHLVSSRIWQAR